MGPSLWYEQRVQILHVEPLRCDEETRRIFSQVGPLDVRACPDHGAFLAALSSAAYQAVVIRLGLAMDGAAFDACPTLKFVVTPTTGLDHIDLHEAARRGVTVVSLRGETAFLETIGSTAEHTWALLLSLLRRIPEAHRDVLAGHWRRDEFLSEELSGKVLGVVGCGRLGRKVCGFGLAFGMRVLGTDHEPAHVERAPKGTSATSLDTLLAEADVVSLHLPLGPETEGFLSSRRLRQMKRGSWLINTARGELVDESALVLALEDGHLAGAALDVLCGDGRWDQGIPVGHRLVAYARTRANLVLSPHLGGYGKSSIERTRRFIAQRFVDAVRQREETPS
jgi:D-3-phosphoglycerate dehydrogenase